MNNTAEILQLNATSNVAEPNNNYAISMNSKIFENNELLIDRSADQIKPLFLKSNHPIDYLILEIGGLAILKFPLKFCNRLFSTINMENGYMYTIPWNKFNMEFIPVISLQFQIIKFIIISSNLCQAELYIQSKFISNDSRMRLVSENLTLQLRQYQEENIILNQNDNNSTNLNFHGNVTGIFIDNVNINEITNFKLKLENYERINYNNIQLQVFTKEIDNNCFYIPFNDLEFSNNLFYNNSESSSIDFSIIQNISIEIKSDIEQDIKIRTFSHNILRISSGLSGLENLSINQTMNNCFRQFITTNYISSENIEQNKTIDGDTFCPITHQEIKKEDKYMKCDKCHKNFIEHALKTWLIENRTCPMCRNTWTSNIIFINKEE